MDNEGPIKTPSAAGAAPTFDDLPPSLTVPEAAAALRRSRAWGYARVADGSIPARRTLAGLRILRSDFVKLLEGAPLAAAPRDAA